jgi:hypothetical protein
MRRWMALGLGLILGLGLTATVQAQPTVDTERATAIKADRVDGLRLALNTVRRIESPTCDVFDDAKVYQRCLNRYLSRLARNINQAVADLNNLYNRCLVAIPVTQYGIPPTEGYQYTAPDLTEFLTTSLDYTFDPATEGFRYFIFTPERCVEPAS